MEKKANRTYVNIWTGKRKNFKMQLKSSNWIENRRQRERGSKWKRVLESKSRECSMWRRWFMPWQTERWHSRFLMCNLNNNTSVSKWKWEKLVYSDTFALYKWFFIFLWHVPRHTLTWGIFCHSFKRFSRFPNTLCSHLLDALTRNGEWHIFCVTSSISLVFWLPLFYLHSVNARSADTN